MIRKSILTSILIVVCFSRVHASDTDVETGKALFQSSCANICHQAPKAGRLKPKQWRVVLKTMQKRMQSVGIEPLSDLQQRQVLAYLTQE